MTITSTAEAMGILEATKSHLIEKARLIAIELGANSQPITSRDVRKAMAERNLLPQHEKEYWLGAVFRDKDIFEWTGQYKTYSDENRNIHERTVKVWKLRT